MGESRWESRITWDDSNRATHEGRTFELWSHGCGEEESDSSAPNAWHLHEVLRTGEVREEPLSPPLCVTRREAARIAELWLLDWRPELGNLDMWRSSDRELHPIYSLLSGATAH
jgi:hypothetical protein